MMVSDKEHIPFAFQLEKNAVKAAEMIYHALDTEIDKEISRGRF